MTKYPRTKKALETLDMYKKINKEAGLLHHWVVTTSIRKLEDDVRDEYLDENPNPKKIPINEIREEIK